MGEVVQKNDLAKSGGGPASGIEVFGVSVCGTCIGLEVFMLLMIVFRLIQLVNFGFRAFQIFTDLSKGFFIPVRFYDVLAAEISRQCGQIRGHARALDRRTPGSWRSRQWSRKCGQVVARAC